MSRRAVLAGGTTVAALALTGCTRSPEAAAPTASRTRAATTPALAGLLDRLGRSVLAGDRTGFTASTSDRDPAFGAVADRTWTSLTALGLTGLSWRAIGADRPLGADRTALLGPDARAHQVQVDWRVPGDPYPARQVGWLTTVGQGDDLRWAGATDGPAEPVPTPIWSLEAVQSARRGRATAVTARSVDPAPWLRSLQAAAAAVTARLPAAVRSGWNGDLVAEVPSTEAVMEAILGVPAGSRRQIAATTWPESTEAHRAPMRIVVNPAAASGLVTAADRLGLDLLLTHEATHVATRSPLSSAPAWLVEGLADAVAYDCWPAGAAAASADLLAAVAAGDGPSALPTDTAFAAGAPDLALRYAEAWLACQYVTRHWSWDRLADLYMAAQSTAVSAAVPAVLGVGEARFTRGWRGFLAELAAGR